MKKKYILGVSKEIPKNVAHELLFGSDVQKDDDKLDYTMNEYGYTLDEYYSIYFMVKCHR